MTRRLFLILLVSAALAPIDSSAAPLPPRPPKARSDVVVFDTSAGVIKIRLFPDKAPLTVENFLGYVDAKFYDGLIFHRVIPNFMIQGGGHDRNLVEQKSREPVRNESANNLPNRRGTIALARKVEPDSGTCQFFINLRDNTSLDWNQDRAGYCVFGEVIEGMDVVDAIAAVKTGNKGMFNDVPLEPVLIRSARRAP